MFNDRWEKAMRTQMNLMAGCSLCVMGDGIRQADGEPLEWCRSFAGRDTHTDLSHSLVRPFSD